MTADATPRPEKTNPEWLSRFGVPAALGVLFLWAYWPILGELTRTWITEPQYSHGFLIPAFALVLLWQRRGDWPVLTAEPSWWGVLFFVLAGVMQAAGGFIYSPWLEQVSLLPFMAGVAMVFGGWQTLRIAGPAIAFLLFMVPLPGRLDKALAGPLQRISTEVSTNALQTFGLFAQAEGNVILLSDYELGVVEACSGLRMLVVFLAASTAVAMLSHRSLLQRAIIVASAIPIALLCNIIRITATGIIHETAGHEMANLVYHDVAGWLMVPMALSLLGIELLLLSKLFIPVGPLPTSGLLGMPMRAPGGATGG